jgi:hypothetical protein
MVNIARVFEDWGNIDEISLTFSTRCTTVKRK